MKKGSKVEFASGVSRKKKTTKNRPRYKKKIDRVKIKIALLEALKKTLGIITTACALCDVNRGFFYELCKEDPEFAQQVKDVNEIVLDFSESKLLQHIKNDNLSATMFHLKYQGRKRGYGIEKQEISADINQTTTIIDWTTNPDEENIKIDDNQTNQ